MDRLVAIIVPAPFTQFVSKHTNLSHCVRSAMKLYLYRGLDNEKVPKDVTHVIVDNSVTAIKRGAFSKCELLLSLIMGDNVKRIEDWAFWRCIALRFVRLSKTLEYIGIHAFRVCESLEALYLPSTVTSIGKYAFSFCRSMRLLVLPHDINVSNVGEQIIHKAGIQQIARAARVVLYDYNNFRSNRRVNEWLIHHMDDSPFHKLCYDSSVTTRQINDYLHERGNDAALVIDTIHGKTPLHMLSMNPHAPADAIAALLDVNMEVAFCLDNQGKMSMDYARDYNVGGLVGIVNGLCIDMRQIENTLKRKRIEEFD